MSSTSVCIGSPQLIFFSPQRMQIFSVVENFQRKYWDIDELKEFEVQIINMMCDREMYFPLAYSGHFALHTPIHFVGDVKRQGPLYHAYAYVSVRCSLHVFSLVMLLDFDDPLFFSGPLPDLMNFGAEWLGGSLKNLVFSHKGVVILLHVILNSSHL